MEGEKLVDICFGFRNLEFEVNFDNFIYITCILCASMVVFFNILLRYKYG